MSLDSLYKDIKKRLSNSAIQTPELDSKLLIQAVTGFDDVDFITRRDTEISAQDMKSIDALVERRLKGEPVSRILGNREFWGLDFIVTPDTLDPRADTETLIEMALKWVKKEGRLNDPLKIVDIGTGTGCIPIALLSELPNATAIAIDISEKALSVARQNAQKHKMSSRIKFIQGDCLDSFDDDNIDLFVSNPPYIPNLDIENLAKEVKNHDPFLALSGGNDGLDYYKKIIFQLKNKLNGKNKAFLEIGFGQLESLTRLVDESNLLLCDSGADIAGIPRVVEISCGDK